MRQGKEIKLRLAGRSYTITISRNLMGRLGWFLKRLDLGSDFIVITTPRLAALYRTSLQKSLAKEGLSFRVELIPDSERAKSERVVARAIESISSFDRGRSAPIVAFGGGVAGDVAGFIAAIYKRGIPYVQVPTTLLAQVDSAIGGKVAIDLPVAKNLVGAFYQPRAVLSDISVLKSLPARQVRSGLAEVIKYAVIKDKDFFVYLEKNLERAIGLDEDVLEQIVARCSAIKAGIVERDECDKKGIRMVLNYGHTIGHAIEAASGYSKRYSHGEAIAIGMVAANRIAAHMGMLREAERARIEELIRRAGLPEKTEGLSMKKVFEAHLHDKKFSAKTNRFVLPMRIGKVKIVAGVEERLVVQALRGCAASH